MERSEKTTLRNTALGTLVVMLVVLGFLALISMRNVLTSIFLGLLLATALRPLMSRLSEGRLPRFIAASVSVLLLVGVIIGFLVLIVPMLIGQATVLVSELPSLYLNLRGWLISSQLRALYLLGERLPEALSNTAIDSADLSAQAVTLLPTVGYVLFVGICTLLFTYYWLLYRERSLRGLLLLLPMEQRATVDLIWQRIESRLGAFLRGQTLLALITGGFSLVGYWAVGMPYALLLALIAALLEYVPLLGPFLAGAIATLAGFSISPRLGLSALAVGVIVQQIENTFLAPRIMDRAVGISPVITLLAFAGFAALFGPVGALLAIPMAATLQVLFLAWLERTDPIEADLTGRSLADRLRYEIRHLSNDIAAYLRQKDADSHSDSDEPEEGIEQILTELEELLAAPVEQHEVGA